MLVSSPQMPVERRSGLAFPRGVKEVIGRPLAHLGQIGILAGGAVASIVTQGLRLRLVLGQILSIGIGSQLVVVVTGAFTGAVFAAQAYFKFHELGMGSATGPVVSIAMCRELGPVLAALMVAGRSGSAMAAEIGTMRVTEQIDALRAMAVDPIDYLVAPRLVAILVSMPVLVAETICCGILAALALAVGVFGVPEPWFTEQLLAHTKPGDVVAGLIKGTLFGLILVVISCHRGLSAGEGAVGVGRATTQAVVDSSLTILVANFFLSLLLEHWFPIASVGP
jgi:phospholipid/cholesterol/gamma-HCH transport system permease protein